MNHYLHPLYRLALEKKRTFGDHVRELFFQLIQQFSGEKIWITYPQNEGLLRIKFRHFNAASVWQVKITIAPETQTYAFEISAGETSHDLEIKEEFSCTLRHPENAVDAESQRALTILDELFKSLSAATCVRRQ